MLDFTLEERIKPNKEILDLLKKSDYEVINGAVKVLDGTNSKFILPVQYIITKPIKLTILEYRINEISNKPFIIEENFKPNLLKRNFKTNALNKVWDTDVTYLD